jgi:hypothetical protein
MGIVDAGFTITDICKGPVRVLLAPADEDIPTNIIDIHAMKTPYGLAGDWFDLGATTGPSSYSRGIEAEGLSVEQVNGDITEDITDVTRGITIPMGGISAENIQIFENATAIGSVTAGANKSAQQSVKIGSFSETERYRVALVGVRPKDAGIVQEPSSGPARGRMVAHVLYNVGLSADEASISMGKGQLWGGDVSFKAYPEPGQAADVATGVWFFENAGTIAGA